MPRLESGTAEDGLANIFWISYLDELPVTAKDIASATRKDPVLACAYDFTLHGWPKAVEDPVLQLYVSCKQELSADLRCLLWGLRVVIPDVYLERLLNDLLREHHGMCCIKSLARGYFWWPGMVGAIEDRVSACRVCASVAKSLLKAPLHPRKWPAKPWERVHMVYGQVARKSSRLKSCRPKPKSCRYRVFKLEEK